MTDVSVQEIAEAEDPHRCEWCASPRSDHYDHGGAIGHDWEPLHEWSGLDECHDECLVCGEVRFQEPDYGDWRGADV